MSQNACAKTWKLRPAVLRLSLLGAFVLSAMALFGHTACEDKAIGRPCDVLTDASAAQGVYNAEALECPSRICLKPVVETGASMPTTPVGPYCSAPCSQDSDCDGALRDPSADKCADNSACLPIVNKCAGNGEPCQYDGRCSKGYTCGIAFVKGKICCQKLCLCKDFLPQTGAPTPIACQGEAAATCQNPNGP